MPIIQRRPSFESIPFQSVLSPALFFHAGTRDKHHTLCFYRGLSRAQLFENCQSGSRNRCVVPSGTTDLQRRRFRSLPDLHLPDGQPPPPRIRPHNRKRSCERLSLLQEIISQPKRRLRKIRIREPRSLPIHPRPQRDRDPVSM